MMTTMTSMVLATSIVWSIKSMNPVKVSISILLSSCSLFFIMSLTSGLSWFPILMLMLFMGGIIMMFMILSSILPNEKSLKTKTLILILITLVMIFSYSPLFLTTESTTLNSKTYLFEMLNFIFMMSLILFYFLSSMSILTAEKSPMRTVYCYQSLIL